ncbi:Hsp20/alpha crystallin family protein [Bacillus aquiflavi]|uniref:Hsp20/alpha crystallin family protein n=1 Tax=Bacillus aquiflavi TaxID=2672567 RepID=A0A6B3W148_9BACI|nr:Hsp20/alpha crystallin family protein [Bacillus aquiflavi]MBA4538569.1 Hsp20/alpha crystallin family protein [Bacillus aquiflavi]NEY82932.1 Hsp20/alpha crystallin family protein [Bacillus aquiflavi]UAC49555.1 Hsp20/alpha crystallin family protein [Bacillus aquiflavi]
MPNESNDHSLLHDFEKWMECFFLDPLTSLLDHSEFRIDLFETGETIIIEALLPHFESHEISVHVEKNELIIKAGSNSSPKKRTVSFPFLLQNKEITATLNNGILEVSISKHNGGTGKNRIITISEINND